MDRLLLVDDDVELCSLLCEYLRDKGIAVDTAHDGEQGLAQLFAGSYDAVILDIMLPKLDGFEVLRHIRGRSGIPVLMLTALGEAVDRIVGLEMGADDYLAKPFNPRELLARIHAIMRRVKPGAVNGQPSEKIVVGDIDLYPATRSVLKQGKAVELTAMEFDFLHLLLLSAGKVVTREQLAQSVLDRELTPFDRSVDVHISNLRKKLGCRVGDNERIKSIRGEGYLYSLPAR